jgi:hypothetical protein
VPCGVRPGDCGRGTHVRHGSPVVPAPAGIRSQVPTVPSTPSCRKMSATSPARHRSVVERSVPWSSVSPPRSCMIDER